MLAVILLYCLNWQKKKSPRKTNRVEAPSTHRGNGVGGRPGDEGDTSNIGVLVSHPCFTGTGNTAHPKDLGIFAN